MKLPSNKFPIHINSTTQKSKLYPGFTLWVNPFVKGYSVVQGEYGSFGVMQLLLCGIFLQKQYVLQEYYTE